MNEQIFLYTISWERPLPLPRALGNITFWWIFFFNYWSLTDILRADGWAYTLTSAPMIQHTNTHVKTPLPCTFKLKPTHIACIKYEIKPCGKSGVRANAPFISRSNQHQRWPFEVFFLIDSPLPPPPSNSLCDIKSIVSLSGLSSHLLKLGRICVGDRVVTLRGSWYLVSVFHQEKW